MSDLSECTPAETLASLYIAHNTLYYVFYSSGALYCLPPLPTSPELISIVLGQTCPQTIFTTSSLAHLFTQELRVLAPSRMPGCLQLHLEQAGIPYTTTLLSLDEIMILGQTTIEQLNVFGQYSISSLFQTVSPLGNVLLREWLLRPSAVLKVIEDRQDAVRVLTLTQNAQQLTEITRNLGHITHIPNLLYRMLTRNSLSHWQTLHSFILHAANIFCEIHALAYSENVFFEPFHNTNIVTCLQGIATQINHIIDFDESVFQSRCFSVKPGVDPELDDLKQAYHNLPATMADAALQANRDHGLETEEELQIVYFPQLGFFISAPNSLNLGIPPQFRTAQATFYKTPIVLAIDAEIGDIHSDIVDRETSHMQQLRQLVMNNSEVLQKVSYDLAAIDCLASFATCAVKLHLVQPSLSDTVTTVITQGFHPLFSNNQGFVPNDTDFTRGTTIVITGPNTCGKSVYLSQVATIVYMAQIGSFVPCAQANIKIVGCIATVFPTRTSTELTSSYACDLQCMLHLLQLNDRSLILIDEFGQNTQSSGTI